MLARKDADPKALLERYRQWLPDELLPDAPPFLRDLRAVFHDRDAMLAIVRKSFADPTYGGCREVPRMHIADALGETDLAVAGLRKVENQEGFREGRMDYGAYWQLWLAPYSGLRAHPEFKKLLREIGLVDYWRQTGKWGDACKPVGTDDFQCQ